MTNFVVASFCSLKLCSHLTYITSMCSLMFLVKILLTTDYKTVLKGNYRELLRNLLSIVSQLMCLLMTSFRNLKMLCSDCPVALCLLWCVLFPLVSQLSVLYGWWPSSRSFITWIDSQKHQGVYIIPWFCESIVDNSRVYTPVSLFLCDKIRWHFVHPYY